MSEAMTVPPIADAPAKRTPTVYFIDDSATMREVVKIAFRRESINVVTCADAASALSQFDQTPPDAVITDVIMPDQDGYSVCTQVKQHPQFGAVPVILMSGVVNKSVADKAVAVKADDLIRKPFQPQELIGRVKTLLAPKSSAPAPDRAPSPSALANLFAPAPAPNHAAPSSYPGAASPFAPASSSAYPPAAPSPFSSAALPALPAGAPEMLPPPSAWPRALAEAFSPRPDAAAQSAPPNPPASSNAHSALSAPRPASPADIQKLRGEIARLDLLVKKLQTELQIERQYNQALELQIRSLTSATD